MAGPPPGAGVPIASFSFVAFEPEVVPAVDVAGEAAGLAPPLVTRCNQFFLAGLGEALALVDADSAVSVFLECLAFAAGDSAGEALSDGDADSAVSFFLECLCFAAGDELGDSAGEGLCAKTAVAGNAR